ncbi:MAG: hypothetical protein IKW30_02495 [Lachnospiraceae bacterium]|nr:hypothetical protein [Lachnospiraceae bacterium]
MEKEDLLLQKRFVELANRSFVQNMFTFTEFLSLPELDLFYKNEPQLRYAGVTVFGGTEGADRKVIRFGNKEELGYEETFPIVCISMEPVLEKFGENLNHRDYLGALMNLGIERENLGDIFIKGKTGYVFCLERIADYIVENLTQIRHTHVKTKILEKQEDFFQKELEEMAVLSASERIDGIVSKVYNMSRNQSLELFRGKKVYVNSRLNENNSYILKKGDIISVRGYGKFIYQGVGYETKKGKLSVKLSIYK